MNIEHELSALENRFGQVADRRKHYSLWLQHHVPMEQWPDEALEALLRDSLDLPPQAELTDSMLEQLVRQGKCGRFGGG